MRAIRRRMKKSKLLLKTETVRELQPRQLSSIAGGNKIEPPPVTHTCWCSVGYICISVV
jgi:mRNA degradation ribonuclease J1/J2